MNTKGNIALIGNDSLGSWWSFQGLGRLVIPAIAVVVGCSIGYGGWLYVLGSVVIAAFIFWPVQIAFGIYAFLVPFDSVSVLGTAEQGTTLTFWVGGASGLALLLTGLLQGRMSVPPRAAWWWATLILWVSVTMLWAIDPSTCVRKLPTIFGLLLLYLIAISLRVTKTELFWVAIAVILGGLIAGLYAAFSYYGGIAFQNERSSLIIAGRETDPNYFAASLLLPISLAIGMFASFPGWIKKGLTLLAVVTMGFAVLLSMSRGALVAIVLILLLYCYRLRANWHFLVVPALLGSLLAWMPTPFFQRLAGASASHGAGRLDIWHVGLALLKRYGLMGAGLDNFPLGYQQFAGLASRFPYHGYMRGAHNTFLNMAVENGIVGFGLFVAGLISQLRVAQHSRVRLAPPLVSYEAACYGLLVAGFFLDLFWWKLFWLAWILLALASRVDECQIRRNAITHHFY